MKISVCYIQYNRIDCLKKSLTLLEKQSYDNIEVVISDDASTDSTEKEITDLKLNYRYPLVYSRLAENCGYDRNYRRCVELASGDYCFVLGNDDAIIGEDSILNLVHFLEKNNYPSVGFVNYFEFTDPQIVVERAKITGIIGTGLDVALRHYNSFSFVGGLIYKKKVFNRFNTNIHDGSIYAQMYIGMAMIIAGEVLFSIKEPIVGKDIIVNNKRPYSYRDNLIRSWSKFKIVDGGLPSVINVVVSALENNNQADSKNVFKVFKKIYSRTFPYWILNYKENNAFPSAFGLFIGLFPYYNKNFRQLTIIHKVLVYLMYLLFGFAALLTPVFVFNKLHKYLY